MPRFIFRLQALLDQKIEIETAAKAAVVEKQRLLDEAQSKLLHLKEIEKRIEGRVHQTREDLVVVAEINTVADVHRRNNYLQALQQDLSEAHDDALVQKFAVEEAEISLGKARAHAVECSREVEKLSKFREKLEARFLAAVAKKEENEQDEVGTIMYLSRRTGP